MKALLLLCLALLSTSWVHASGNALNRYAADEQAARHVHAMLDDELWAQVVRIDNRRRTGDFPRVAWATVFELGERLWIYLPRYGTRSLSRFASRLEEDKLDLSDVLQHLHEGFRGHEVAVDDDATWVGPVAWETSLGLLDAEVPNGCFVRSVAWFQRLQSAGAPLRDAQLLLYYGGSGAARWGHTVLYYETDAGMYYWDSRDPRAARPVPGGAVQDSLALARRVSPAQAGGQLDSARTFDLMPAS
ncbi:hypothetical protein [Actomonas aquatica]|uniref:Peptidase C39-like domain-containing protein n=1 Tax=Actomonas aquatica TaxID=2866162 RepID=A0ABZ1C7W8_9BACT|nr:hypothetical protein [Opitutus sp. WL0086]WRQ86634.1 hypothetical protein K1X11_017620 [Opitutus sp. WL0086]